MEDTRTLKVRKTQRVSTARTQDLSTRERVNFVIDSALMNLLREESKIRKVPMSRIIDAAILAYLGNMEQDIILYHDVSITICSKKTSQSVKKVIEVIKETFGNYILTSCLINPGENEPVLGTKIRLYVSDCESEQFAKLCSYLSSVRTNETIRVMLDQRQILDND